MKWEDVAPQASLFLFTFIILWVYVHISKVQGILDQAIRNQRICGNQAFESETVRYAAWNASQHRYNTFKIVLLVIGIISMVVYVATIFITLLKKTPEIRTSDLVTQLVFMVAMLSITIAILAVVYSIFGWKRRAFMINDVDNYRKDIKHIIDALADIPTPTETGDRGTWLRYRDMLVRRIAKRDNMSSPLEAEDMLEDLLVKTDKQAALSALGSPPEIINVMEFDRQRDYTMLLALINKHSAADKVNDRISALNRLSNIDKHNPMIKYAKRFKRIHSVLIVATFLAAYAWLRTMMSHKVYGIAISIFVVVFVTAMYMSL